MPRRDRCDASRRSPGSWSRRESPWVQRPCNYDTLVHVATSPAGVYCRISQDRDGAGLGVERQEQDCRNLPTARSRWRTVYTDNDIRVFRQKTTGYQALLEPSRPESSGRAGVAPRRLHRSPRSWSTTSLFGAQCDDALRDRRPLGSVDTVGPGHGPHVGHVERYESEHKSERIQPGPPAAGHGRGPARRTRAPTATNRRLTVRTVRPRWSPPPPRRSSPGSVCDRSCATSTSAMCRPRPVRAVVEPAAAGHPDTAAHRRAVSPPGRGCRRGAVARPDRRIHLASRPSDPHRPVTRPQQRPGRHRQILRHRPVPVRDMRRGVAAKHLRR